MIYLSVEDIIKINAKLIATTSAGEITGVKDAAALDMAVKQPMQIIFGKELQPSIFDKAAILAINLAKKHPFHNANKRTSLVAMISLLEINGQTTSFSQEEIARLILQLTTSSDEFAVLKEEIAGCLQSFGQLVEPDM